MLTNANVLIFAGVLLLQFGEAAPARADDLDACNSAISQYPEFSDLVACTPPETGDKPPESSLDLPDRAAARPPETEALDAVAAVRPRAERGDPVAQFLLGGAYAFGKGVKQDDAEAVKWWTKAAKQGLASAQLMLGVTYANGNGVPQDAVEAAKWYRLAAEQGDPGAQNALGVLYAEGGGAPQDLRPESLRTRAEGGLARDDAEAVKWFRLAAAQSHAGGETNLGLMYANGRGVPQDYAEAVKWLRRPADRGHGRAQAKLGAMYILGQGVPQDYVLAHMWFNLAAAQGDEVAAGFRDDIAREMTAEQLVEAQRLAREWKPRSLSDDFSDLITDEPPAIKRQSHFGANDRPMSAGTGILDD